MSENYSEQYAEIGKLLSGARKNMRLSQAEAGQILHIRVRYLDALEHGRLDELPGISYARGYLLSYAAFLGLDKDEVLRRFGLVEDMIEKRGLYFPQVLSRSKTPTGPMIWGGIIAVVLVYGLWSVLLKPNHINVSIVENYVPGAMQDPASAVANPYDVACLRTQDVLYPPCYSIWPPHFSLLPLHQGKIDSVLELPHLFK